MPGVRELRRFGGRISGREEFRFHDLRHEVGRRVAREDGVGAVMNVLGHADISTSMRYSHYDDAMKRASLEKIGRRKSRDIPEVIRGTKAK